MRSIEAIEAKEALRSWALDSAIDEADIRGIRATPDSIFQLAKEKVRDIHPEEIVNLVFNIPQGG